MTDPRDGEFILTDSCMWERNKRDKTKFPHSIEVIDRATGQVRYIKGGSVIKFLSGQMTEERTQITYNKQNDSPKKIKIK